LDRGIGVWGLGIGDWGLGPIPNPQSPIPNPQSPIPILKSNLQKLSQIKIFINFNNDKIINTNLLKMSDVIKEILNKEKRLR